MCRTKTKKSTREREPEKRGNIGGRGVCMGQRRKAGGRVKRGKGKGVEVR